MNEINYPSQKTYYILKDGSEIISYGFVEPNQVMHTMLVISNEFTNKELWIEELNNNNIDTSEL